MTVHSHCVESCSLINSKNCANFTVIGPHLIYRQISTRQIYNFQPSSWRCWSPENQGSACRTRISSCEASAVEPLDSISLFYLSKAGIWWLPGIPFLGQWEPIPHFSKVTSKWPEHPFWAENTIFMPQFRPGDVKPWKYSAPMMGAPITNGADRAMINDIHAIWSFYKMIAHIMIFMHNDQLRTVHDDIQTVKIDIQ